MASKLDYRDRLIDFEDARSRLVEVINSLENARRKMEDRGDLNAAAALYDQIRHAKAERDQYADKQSEYENDLHSLNEYSDLVSTIQYVSGFLERIRTDITELSALCRQLDELSAGLIAKLPLQPPGPEPSEILISDYLDRDEYDFIEIEVNDETSEDEEGIYISDIPVVEVNDTQAKILDASQYIGLYQFSSGDQISVTAIEGQLFWRGTDCPEIALYRIVDSEFAPDLHVVFNVSLHDRVESLTLIQRGQQEEIAQRLSD